MSILNISRRHFLKGAGIATSALVIAVALPANAAIDIDTQEDLIHWQKKQAQYCSLV